MKNMHTDVELLKGKNSTYGRTYESALPYTSVTLKCFYINFILHMRTSLHLQILYNVSMKDCVC